jgi:uncharacterized protein (TIGR02246 family)
VPADVSRTEPPDGNRRAADQAIRDVESQYDAAWARGDIVAILDCLADDAVLVSPRGDVARGRGEIESLLRDFLVGEARGTQHASRLLRVEFVTDEVAVVDGEAVIARSSPGNQVEAVVLRHGFTDVLVIRSGRWCIGHIRAYPWSEQ